MTRVGIHLHLQSNPIVVIDVVNAYEKGSFYCVYTEDGRVQKYPIANIWRVVEDYPETDRANKSKT